MPEKARLKAGSDEGGRSARRVLSIFELMLSRGEPVTVAELVGALGIPKSTAYELVRTLPAAGYVERSGGFSYFLGRKLFELVSPEPELVDGTMALPDAPGLGIDLNDDLVERLRTDRRAGR